MPGTDTVDIAVGETPNFDKGSCCRLFRMAAAGTVEDIQQIAVFESCLHLLEETCGFSKEFCIFIVFL